MLGRYRQTLRLWSDPVGRVLFRLHMRPNHLTVMGLGVSLLAAGAFVDGRQRVAGLLLIFAGLFDFFDGSLARASGQVTPFGAFLDSVIDRYSDLVVLLGIVVYFARMPHQRPALAAMAGVVGSVMTSYTKARAESIGVPCRVGLMERPERMICLIAGAMLDLLEPALWVLAVLANVTAVQRILFTRRAMRDAVVLMALAVLFAAVASGAEAPPDETTRWTHAVEAMQQGDPQPAIREFAADAAMNGVIGDYTRWLLADALARREDWAGARAAVAGIAERYRDSRLAPAALVAGAVFATRAGDEAGAQALLVKLIDSYPDSAELPKALYLLGAVAEARGQREAAAAAYRELTIVAPTTGWADGAGDRLVALARGGVALPELSFAQRLDRAERLLRGGVHETAAQEAERIAAEARETGIVVRALRVVAEASQRLGRYDLAARTLGLAAGRAPTDRRPALQLEEARLLARAGKKERALALFDAVARTGAESEASEAIFQRARLLEDLHRDRDAGAAYRSLAHRYPAREVAGAALWRLGWIAWERHDARTAEREWTRLSEIPGGRAYRVAALYWTGRARERVAGHAAAARFYQRVVADAPHSYYGVLAARRVNAPARPASPSEPTLRLPDDPSAAIATDPGYARVELLRRIGLVAFAADELEDVVQRSVGDPVRLYGLSSTYVRDERYHLALRILRRHFAALAASGSASLPRALWEMLYPFAWRDQIKDSAERVGLDPYLVAAVIREESSYYPRATSRTGARGLMQLMPATAQPMAEVRGLPFQGGALLDEPGANLQLGTGFLAGLMRDFGDPRLALAAYNAGPRRCREWLKARHDGDIEAFVENIPFDETRQYVKRVMLSWEEYRRLYAGR